MGKRRRRGISTTILLLSASKYSRPSADHGRPADRGEMLTSPKLPSKEIFQRRIAEQNDLESVAICGSH